MHEYLSTLTDSCLFFFFLPLRLSDWWDCPYRIMGNVVFHDKIIVNIMRKRLLYQSINRQLTTSELFEQMLLLIKKNKK